MKSVEHFIYQVHMYIRIQYQVNCQTIAFLPFSPSFKLVCTVVLLDIISILSIGQSACVKFCWSRNSNTPSPMASYSAHASLL